MTITLPQCAHCREAFEMTRPNQRYCSSVCSKRASKVRKRQRERAQREVKYCRNCGEPKPSRKGDYCSKADCQRHAIRAARPNRSAEVQERERARNRVRKARARDHRLAERGPKPNCVVCEVELRWWGASYCSGVECQREKNRRENRAYYEANQDAHRSRASQYRARKIGTTVEPVNVATIYERDRWRCGLCSKRIDQTLRYPHPMSRSIDHIIPISCGGTHTAGSLQAAHLRCNVAKGNRGGGEQLALL